MPKKKTTEETIEDFMEIHGDTYDYSEVVYRGSMIKVKIICKTHGEFEQKPTYHLGGSLCPTCSRTNATTKVRLTNEQFISVSNNTHANKYDYSESTYTKGHNKVSIICPIHGLFKQKANDHMRGVGCRKCGSESTSKHLTTSTEEFMRRVKQTHGDTYGYEKTVYKGCDKKITVTCHIHGDFHQKARDHMNSYGCPTCGVIRRSDNARKTTKQFVIDANNVHGEGTYGYELVNYTSALNRVKIICKIHGVFEQKASSHLLYGCNKCGYIKAELHKIDPNAPCTLYLLKFTNKDGSFYKVGITTKGIKTRFNGAKCNQYTISEVCLFNDTYERCIIIEQTLLTRYYTHSFDPRDHGLPSFGGGETECFNESALLPLIEEFEELLK
jgi:hypothetical protein